MYVKVISLVVYTTVYAMLFISVPYCTIPVVLEEWSLSISKWGGGFKYFFSEVDSTGESLFKTARRLFTSSKPVLILLAPY